MKKHSLIPGKRSICVLSLRQVAAPLLVAIGFLFAACDSMPKAPRVSAVTQPFSRETATVKIPFQGDEAKVEVKLAHFPANQAAVDGLKALENGDLETALTRFQAATKEKPDNWTYQFALAVTYEALGRDAEAQRHYENTNLLKGKEGYFDAHAGLKRIEARAGAK
jgi:hypothetical protein